MLIVLLASKVNASNHTKYVSLSNEKCKNQPSLVNLHPNEYNQELEYHPFAVKLDRYVLEVAIFLLNYLKKYAFQI